MLNSFSFSPLDLEETEQLPPGQKVVFSDMPSIIQKTDERFEKPEPVVLKEEFSPISHIGLG
jgi:hypothetical protein